MNTAGTDHFDNNAHITWSDVQYRRLNELNADNQTLNSRFESSQKRDEAFQYIEKKLAKQARFQLKQLKNNHRRPALCLLESQLVNTLTENGFVQVTTPTIMSRGLLSKMTITETHPLHKQIFWLDNDKCLRPMLAPHLYYLLKDLLRLWERPVRIFEIGTCYRKESQGSKHSQEFTMLNLVEMGTPQDKRLEILETMAEMVTKTAGVEEYSFETESSTVYGETTDITTEINNQTIELGSAAMGPHPLDKAWRITDTWVGIGFGLERLLMAQKQSTNLAKMGRSLAYLDGIRLNV